MRSLPLLAILSISPLAVAQCIPAGTTPITITQDSISGPNPIGFAFPIFGTTYSDIHISDHGICWLTNGGVPATPAATPLVYTPAATSLVGGNAVIAPHWSDTIPGTTGMFFIDSTATTCTVTWFEVQSFGFPTPLMSFQLILDITGTITMVYGPNVTNNSTFGGISDNGVVGIFDGAGLPPASLLNTSPVVGTDTVYQEYLAANTFDMAGDSLLFIPTSPGWAVIHTAGGAGCARTETYGVGCDGLVLSSATQPVLGTNWDLTTTGFNPISALGFTYFSFGRAIPPIPVNTLGFNAPGCDVNIDLAQIITSLTGVVAAGSTTVSVAVPTGTSWIGLEIDAQTIGLTNNNPAGFATSNGECGFFGL